jgi:hypothetical protein
MRSVPLGRLLLAGLMVTTAATATALSANAASTKTVTEATTSGCGPTYTSHSASATAPWPGSSVPWRSVGKGWILGTVTAKQSQNATQTLYLASPGGQRYKVGAAPSGAQLVDWSGSMDALFVTQGATPKTTIYVVNMKTGQTNGFSVYSGDGYISLSFTHPSGQGVLVMSTSSPNGGGYLPLRRYSLTGTRLLCYPNSFPGAGGAEGFTESPVGPDLVTDTQNGLEVMSNAGRPIRLLRPPHGFSCGTLNWWSSQTVLANCASGSTAELWAFPLSGARPTQISRKGQSAIFIGAWRLPSGTYAQEAACGSSWLERLNANGTGTQMIIPGAQDAGSVQPLGTDGNQLSLLLTGGCDGHTPFSKVDWYNPATNKATTVLGASAGGGFVANALLYPEN